MTAKESSIEKQHMVIEVIRLAEMDIPNGLSLPESHVIHFCKMYGLSEEEQAGVLRWHNHIANERGRRQYVQRLREMIQCGATLMFHLPDETIVIVKQVYDYDWEDDDLDILVQVLEQKRNFKVPFTTTFWLSWDKDTKLSSLDGPEKK